ncbi:MAG: hypothetical protein V2A73_00185, partial [Pseudomonadota bacterium]
MYKCRRPIFLSALVLAAAAGCAHSAREVRRARSVVYQTDFATVWNAVLAAVRAQYRVGFVEDAARGVLRTRWYLIERTANAEASADTLVVSGQSVADLRPGKYFRLLARVKGGPPWTVEIDGEAAEYRPGFTLLAPYPRGSIDEPKWVDGRIDGMYVRIYERLARHAVETGNSSRPPARPRLDTSRWVGLPQPAAQTIARLHQAAVIGDVDAIKLDLADPFLLD